METKTKLRRRLPRHERERLIVDEAIRFFAEVGFEGQTRALAERLGVTQPLLYRYFPDKVSLIERVYHEVFVDGWDEAWEEELADRSRPLAERVCTFYGHYVAQNFKYQQVRLFMFASLKDQAMANRYLAFTRQHLFIPLAREIRAEAGLDPAHAVTECEIECAAGLHGAIGYMALRRWVFDDQVYGDTHAVIAALTGSFISGAVAMVRSMASAPAPCLTEQV